MACTDQFTISITGADIECTIMVESDSESLSFGAGDQTFDTDDEADLAIAVTAVSFTYTVGNPARSVFVSRWSKNRIGVGSAQAGNGPGLSSITFDPTTPDLTGAANSVKSGTVTVGLPRYASGYRGSDDSVGDSDDLTTGVSDTYLVEIFMRTATESIAGSTTNLSPPNP